jgi:hypothetical protein
LQIGLLVIALVALPSATHAQASQGGNDAEQKLQQLESKLKMLTDALGTQQDQINRLQHDLTVSTEQLHQTETRLLSVESMQSRPADEVVTALRSAVEGIKEGQTNATNGEAVALASTKTRLDALENPLTLHYKGLQISPGGFLAAETVFRTRNENSDMGSSFGSLPFDGVANASLSEFHVSARASRASLLLKTKFGENSLTGFYEIDWYGVTAANDNKSNSYSPRQRQLWVRSDFQNGWSLTTGQMWSLMVQHKVGIQTQNEYSAPGDLIEGSFVLGHVWERQTGFRIVKNFNNKTFLGFALENPQTTYSATNAPANIFGLQSSSNATSPSSDVIPYASGIAAGFSTDTAPDLIAKAAFDPGWGHYEVKSIGRFFRTRENGITYKTEGGGLGASSKMPLTRKLDFNSEGLIGEGIGRYSSGGGPDITVRPNGSPVLIHQLQLMSGFEYRPTLRLSTYAFEGNEYYQRAAYVNAAGQGVGYGSPLINNSECEVEVPAAGTPSCSAQNRDMNQVIGGFWFRFFRGPNGTMQYGMNAEHLRRDTWHAVGGAPKGSDTIVETSVRYVLP